MQTREPRIPKLPQVSPTTVSSVALEWSSNNKTAADFVESVMERLEVKNPEIAEYLKQVYLRNRGSRNIPLSAMLVYACNVYRIYEVETQGQLPVVSAEIRSAAIREDIRRDIRGFYLRIIKTIDENVLASALPLLTEHALSGDIDSTVLVMQPGLVVYKMLENQMESDELSKQLGS